MRIPLCLSILALVAATECHAQAYKWQDAEGKVHYGDRPPPGAAADPVRTQRITPEQARQGEELRQRMLERAGRDARDRAAENAERAAALAAQHEQDAAAAPACLDARKKLDVLEEARPVYRTPAGALRVKYPGDAYDGERVYLDDAERAQEIAAVEQQIADTCNPRNDPGQALARQEQIRGERCEAEREKLRLLSRQGSHAVDSEIDAAKAQASYYCGP
jgi:hypothetical protein